jgi:hypothetical protein
MRVYTFLLFCFIMASCSKQPGECTYQHECSSYGATLFFSGYSKAELDTVILKQYKRDSTFSQLQKTGALTNPDTFHELTFMGFTHHAYLSPTIDYEVIIVRTGQAFKIHLGNVITTKEVQCGKGYSCASAFQQPHVEGGDPIIFSTSPGTYYLGLKR